ncbi:MAG: DUF2461 domain-containing protein [Bacteroidales bacterium]|nr:DUF2461 domain-containing protein [Bacteroidales bacterium]
MKPNPDTLPFFEELERNNNREWFNANRPRWEAIKHDFEELTAHVIEAVQPYDPSIAGCTAKNTQYRIYRDLRFSPDKRPYKCHISFFLATGGRKQGGMPGYYLQMGQEDYGLQGNCTLGGGIFMPSPEALNAIRQEIFYNPDEFKSIMSEPRYQRYFGDDFFTIHKLSRVPKGYPADWPDGDLLKYKDYCTMHTVPARYLDSDDFFDYIIDVFRASVPLNKFIQKAMYELI